MNRRSDRAGVFAVATVLLLLHGHMQEQGEGFVGNSCLKAQYREGVSPGSIV